MDSKTMATASNSNGVISAEEAELYDRQIRLWGLDAQKQLRTSHLLVVGDLNYLATEACKNLVLAGIGSVTLCDTKPIEANDIDANFAYSKQDIGKNRCDILHQVLHLLNPTVEIKVDMKKAAEIDEKYLASGGYNIVVMISSNVDLLKKVSTICHLLEVKFFAANCYGGFGFCFIDLGKHYYYESALDGDMNGDNEQVKQILEYKDMNSFFTKRWDDPSMINKKRQPGLQSYFIIRAILLYLKSNAKLVEESVDDIEKCVELVKEECIRQDVDKLDLSSLTDDLPYVVGDLCAAGALLGATVAQEIIQATSHSNKPHDNCVFLNVRNMGLHVVKI